MREARHGSVRRRSFTRKAIPPPSPFPRVLSASFNPFPRSPGAGFADPRFAAPQFRQRGQPRSFQHEKVRSHHRRSTIGKPVSITVSKASCVAPAIRPGGLPPPRNSDRELQQEFKHPVILPTHLASSLYMTRAP